MRRRRFVLLCLASPLLGLAALELSLRFLVLTDSGLARSLGASLRRAELWADPRSDEDFWRLHQRLTGEPPPIPEKLFHPELGWVSELLERDTLRHREWNEADPRRPVLLYGSSYAYCNTPAEDCFQTLLEHSDLRERFVLLNHGVRGYGLDQVLLLLRATLPRFAGRAPLVVVGIHLDEDLDRCALTLRGWSKPRLTLRGERLEGEVPVPPLRPSDPPPPLALRSLSWNGLLHGTRLVPAGLREDLLGEGELAERKRELAGAVLDAIQREIESHGAEGFYLLFHGEERLVAGPRLDWREAFVVRHLARRGLGYVSSRAAILEDAAARGARVGGHFGRGGLVSQHLDASGNLAAFQSLRAGLLGRFEPPLAAWDFAATRGADGEELASWESGYERGLPMPQALFRLRIRVEGKRPTRVEYDLDGRVSSFESLVGHYPPALLEEEPKDACLRLEADGERLAELRLRGDSGPQEVQVDLAGRRRLSLVASDGGDGDEGDVLLLVRPTFR